MSLRLLAPHLRLQLSKQADYSGNCSRLLLDCFSHAGSQVAGSRCCSVLPGKLGQAAAVRHPHSKRRRTGAAGGARAHVTARSASRIKEPCRGRRGAPLVRRPDPAREAGNVRPRFSSSRASALVREGIDVATSKGIFRREFQVRSSRGRLTIAVHVVRIN